MSHTLRITHEYDDGHAVTTERPQPGDAKVEHDRLAARWKAAGWPFERDSARLTLTRVRNIDYWCRETVAHIPD